jgi:IS5 family transposase
MWRQRLKKRIRVTLDSTGIKVSHRGEWRRRHCVRKRHGWIKLHVAMDEKSKQVLSFRITSENAHDSEMFIPLLKQVEGKIGPWKIKKALADRGYDSKRNFNYAEKRGVIPTIRPRMNATNDSRQPLTRKRLVKSIRRHGYKEWAKKAGYGFRWAVEGFFSTFKRLYGEFLRATSPQGMLRELIMKLHFYNQLINYKRTSTCR